MIQIAVRLDDELVAQVDDLVRNGVVTSRSHAVRDGLKALVDQQRRRSVAEAIVEGYRPVAPDRQRSRLERRGDHCHDCRGAVVTPAQGDIWWAEAEDQRRPVLVVTRSESIPVLNRILVAPVSRTVRGIPTELPLDADDGLPEPCAASFDNLQPIRKSFLTDRVGSVRNRRHEICRRVRSPSPTADRRPEVPSHPLVVTHIGDVLSVLGAGSPLNRRRGRSGT